MPLDQSAVKTKGSPEWWMTTLAAKMLDRNRILRFAILDAYRSGRPPLAGASPSARKAFYDFMHMTRTNVARVVVRAPGERMSVRAIRTAAADDDNGDATAWRYWTGAGLDVVETDVYSNMLTFAEAYVRVAQGADGQPVAFSCNPWETIIVPDPLNPLMPKAALHLVWDEWAGADFAYLWLPGEQWVASSPRPSPPQRVSVPGAYIPRPSGRWRWTGIPRMSFSSGAFTMRAIRPKPEDPDAAAFIDDGGPYCETYDQQVVPVVPYINRDGVGEFEEHLDLLDRINHTTMVRVVIAAVQAYKQRALEQKEGGPDRLPKLDPDTGDPINWDEVFMPGPDALWKLPPGVTIKELNEAQLQSIIMAGQEDYKQASSVMSIPFSLFSPDGVNQSAEGAQLTREGLVFKVEDRDRIAGRSDARVVSLMFQFGPDEDRYVGDGPQRADRADAGRIVIDWTPAERFSLAEKSQADSQNKSLSPDMAAQKIWGLTPDEVGINRAQRAAEQLLNPQGTPGQQLDGTLNDIRLRQQQTDRQLNQPTSSRQQPELVSGGSPTAAG